MKKSDDGNGEQENERNKLMLLSHLELLAS